ncbi:toxin C-terminal domain-containing protein [Niameybacter massiliensis]|uniref:Toxin C-terminal domain-containing protein n=1 Tax=Holtiella tumoricola TaxID=3018743 RepID=A0AA42J1L3_9FIRM|nr:toxin C-terminal domain-containing protein [Holtiella tumoricola]MDA3732363.1 toxin C-terminal domain-containing protein [Holtiella tumoricola]
MTKQRQIRIKYTNKEIKQVAAELGHTLTNYRTFNDQLIFTDGKNFISHDIDQHNGGFWKVAKSVKKLNSKDKRYGTFSRDLKTRIGG